PGPRSQRAAEAGRSGSDRPDQPASALRACRPRGTPWRMDRLGGAGDVDRGRRGDQRTGDRAGLEVPVDEAELVVGRIVVLVRVVLVGFPVFDEIGGSVLVVIGRVVRGVFGGSRVVIGAELVIG